MADFDNKELLKRLEIVEIKQELRDLVSLYCVACDDHDLETVMSLFAEDAVFRNPDSSSHFKGHDEILNMYVSSHDYMRLTYHWIHDHLVTVNGSDSASGIAIGHVEANMNGTILVGGFRYYDDYVRIDSKWLFAERRIEFLYFVPATQYLTALDSTARVAGANGLVEADYPEKLASWKRWKEKLSAA